MAERMLRVIGPTGTLVFEEHLGREQDVVLQRAAFDVDGLADDFRVVVTSAQAPSPLVDVGVEPPAPPEPPEPVIVTVTDVQVLSPDHVELFASKDGWRFRLVASNGEIVAASEGYRHKSNARRAARRFGLEIVEVPR